MLPPCPSPMWRELGTRIIDYLNSYDHMKIKHADPSTTSKLSFVFLRSRLILMRDCDPADPDDQEYCRSLNCTSSPMACSKKEGFESTVESTVESSVSE